MKKKSYMDEVMGCATKSKKTVSKPKKSKMSKTKK